MKITETINNQLMHKSIRAFQDKPLTQEEVELLIKVGQHAASSTFMQAYSIISITDETLKQELASISQQPYVATAGHLFVVVVDQHRVAQIAEAWGESTELCGCGDRFISGLTDAIAVTQNMVIAAESLGMGTVYLGSILNDVSKVCELLRLPKYVYPAVGLAVGWPNQEPQLKPRLPLSIIHMENQYQPLQNPLEDLAEYDREVNEYYDLRDANKRVDYYTKQMASRMKKIHPNRLHILKQIQAQGFLNNE